MYQIWPIVFQYTRSILNFAPKLFNTSFNIIDFLQQVSLRSIFYLFLNYQDLKDDILKAEMGAARSILEKSTMMLLTTSKVNKRLQQESSCLLVSKSGRQQDEEIFGLRSFFLCCCTQSLHCFCNYDHFLVTDLLEAPRLQICQGQQRRCLQENERSHGHDNISSTR